ncbi:hypothetical protein ACFT1A_23005 [Rhodococcus sp. NPDC057135]|uniref:hypothetical protein n=1 Tax=Rhodococcus sp. NPDC057135 TaxID=3346028 RepID=UPI00363461CC
MSLPQLTLDEALLLELLSSNGDTLGNGKLRQKASFGKERYRTAANSLVDKNLVRKAGGRGGSVVRESSTKDSDDDESVTTLTVPFRVRELNLYAPMVDVLREFPLRKSGVAPLTVDDVANQGKRSTGGTWSRSDLVTVSVRRFDYVPGIFLEATTVEVKPFDQVNVTAVYEALAHRRASTHAVVAFHIPAYLTEALKRPLREVRTVASSHGIGVVTFADPGDSTTWRAREEAERVEPDPVRLNKLIEKQLSAGSRERIANELRRNMQFRDVSPSGLSIPENRLVESVGN